MSTSALSNRKQALVKRLFGDKEISIETGRFAKQATGAVVVRLGDTMSLVATVAAPGREGLDFFPLTVDYREKVYAAGKFPGGFIKREGRPATKEILTSRLIDRPIRPLFPEEFRQEVQIQAAPISADRMNDPDILSIIGASASLAIIPDLPYLGPIGAVRLGRIDDRLIPFPTTLELADSDLDLIVASTKERIVMIEGFGREIPEPEMLEAIDACHQLNQGLIELQLELREQLGLPPLQAGPSEPDPLMLRLYDRYAKEMKEAKKVRVKQERNEAVQALEDRIIEALCPDQGEATFSKENGEGAEPTPTEVKTAFHSLQERVVREMILEGYRPDGRGPKDLRPISCEVDLLPMTHGSALFQRGETQALVTTVLGTSADEQRIDGIMEEYSKKFYLDYNMPPFAVGEVRPIRGPGRREIGHGMLAERSVAPVLPDPNRFPYTIRVISDILESNGSSSMASVCGATLSLMDAGVPISDPVGGISIGLVEDLDPNSDRFVLLTDIIGDEDHYGDMDFKVSGTQHGITGIQLDVKNLGLTEEIVRATLDQAREARVEILRAMLRAIKRPRDDISSFAPRLIQLQINPEKIGLLIGPGGKNIRRLQEETGTKVEIDDNGVVTIAGPSADGAQECRDRIEAMTAGVQVGKIYEGKVLSVKDFGAFVELLPGQDGMVHISELTDGYINNVNDVCRTGDLMLVKVIAIDDQDRVKLSRRQALAERGITDPVSSQPKSPGGGNGGSNDRGDRGDRGGSGGGSGGSGGGRRSSGPPRNRDRDRDRDRSR